MRYMILDLETETHVGYKRKSNPFLVNNYIVLRGYKISGDRQCSWQRFNSVDEVTELDIPKDVGIIVCHNAKFELLYEKRFSPTSIAAFFKRGGRIWCTQYAEFLLSGQRENSAMISLNDTSVRYGGQTKIDGVKELWESGVLTSAIDHDLLLDYLVGTEEEGRNGGDIGNTEIVFLGQLKLASTMGMIPAIKARMDGLCATSEMEFNGLKIDMVAAKEDCLERMREETSLLKQLEGDIAHIPTEVGFNWASPVHKSCLIFGGTIRYKKSAPYTDENGKAARKRQTARWPLFDKVAVDPDSEHVHEEGGVYFRRGTDKRGNTIALQQDMFISGKKAGSAKFKNVQVPGEIKTKIQDFFYTCEQMTEPSDDWKGKLTDAYGKPIYQTNSDVVEALSGRGIPFIKLLDRLNFVTKELGTYYIRRGKGNKPGGMLTCVDKDNIVHHSLNHCIVVTARLSSSNPNMQNIPKAGKSKVKRMFVSRFPGGLMGEIDYSQLEVVAQGLLSLDKKLVEDLNNKIDFHCKRVALKYSIPYEFAIVACKDENHPEYSVWQPRRTDIKNFSFQRAYGAGAEAISVKTGIPKSEVEELIANEEKEYPGIVRFNNRVAQEVQATAVRFRDPSRGWREFQRGTYTSITGCVYTFRSYDAPSWLRAKGILQNFKPTEMKNYPVQGIGGEIVQMMLGVLWRYFVQHDNFGGKALLVNTVHDCVWFDLHPDVAYKVMKKAHEILERVPQTLEKLFGIRSPVPFPAEAEMGLNMQDLHSLEKYNVHSS